MMAMTMIRREEESAARCDGAKDALGRRQEACRVNVWLCRGRWDEASKKPAGGNDDEVHENVTKDAGV